METLLPKYIFHFGSAPPLSSQYKSFRMVPEAARICLASQKRMQNPEELDASLTKLFAESGLVLKNYDIYFLGKKLHQKRSEMWSILRIHCKEKNLPGFNGLFGVTFLHGRAVKTTSEGEEYVKTRNGYYILRMSQIKRLLTDDNGNFLSRSCILIPEIGYVRLSLLEKFIKIEGLDIVNDFATGMSNYRKRKDYAQRKSRMKEWAHSTKTSAEHAVRRAITKKLFKPFYTNIEGSAAVTEYVRFVRQVLSEMEIREFGSITSLGDASTREVKTVDPSLDSFKMSTVRW